MKSNVSEVNAFASSLDNVFADSLTQGAKIRVNAEDKIVELVIPYLNDYSISEIIKMKKRTPFEFEINPSGKNLVVSFYIG